MCPKGPGILWPRNDCCYDYHHHHGKEHLVTPNCPQVPCQREVQLECGLAMSPSKQGRWEGGQPWENQSLCLGH